MKRLILLLSILLIGVAPLHAAFDGIRAVASLHDIPQAVSASSANEQAQLNSRVYDPQIGRFLSPDPVIQDPNNLQCCNRYSYCKNNPLIYTDPTGYDFITNAPYMAQSNLQTAMAMEANRVEFTAGIVEGVTMQGNAQASMVAYQMMAGGPDSGAYQMAAAGMERNDAYLEATIQEHTDSGISEDSAMRAAGRVVGRNSDMIVSVVADGAGPAIAYAKSRLDAASAKTGNQTTLDPSSASPGSGGQTTSVDLKQAGSYTNYHESGKTYDGKGSRTRSQVSARRVEKETGDKHVATDWKSSSSDREAFKDESKRIDSHGGAKSEDNHNKIESPGKQYRIEDEDSIP